jgi:hypothetical protein
MTALQIILSHTQAAFSGRREPEACPLQDFENDFCPIHSSDLTGAVGLFSFVLSFPFRQV